MARFTTLAQMPVEPPRANTRGTSNSPFVWAVFLAVSWTWCIGMFLPVLLVRDYGIWGFVAFAIPNVVGAAAMGWVIRSQDASRWCVIQHETMVRVFSAVTVAFHLWFVWYLSHAGWVSGEWWPWICVGVFGIALFSGLRADKPSEALTPFFISVVVIAFSFWVGLEVKIPEPSDRGFWGIPAVVWVAPVCIFGFLLCPYLDATFHRARQNLGLRASRIAFTIGFGFFFFAMILFTVAYSGLLLGTSLAGPRVLTAIVMHMLIQSGFTCGLHIREMVSSVGTAHRVRMSGTIMSAGVIAILGGAAALFRFQVSENISPGFELGYRIILSAYGLLFPAYVWLVMIPLRASDRLPSARHVIVWLGACAIATPAFWMGFIQKQEWWLVPGVVVLLAARLLIARSDDAESGRQGSPVPTIPRDSTPVLSAAAEAPSGEVPDSRS